MGKQIKIQQPPNLSQALTLELLGQVILVRRTQSQLRLEDAAMLCNVAKHTLQNIENGGGINKFETILHVCHGLGIQLRNLKNKVNERYDHLLGELNSITSIKF